MMRVQADAWLSNENSDEYWAEGVKCHVDVELTDADEVRIGVVLGGETSDATTLYLSQASADRLARFLAAASVSDGCPSMTVFDWAASYTEAQRIEYSFSVAARHNAAVRRVEQVLYPEIEAATEALALALTSSDPENLIVGLRRFSSIGELARFEAEKLEGRA